jgi:signal transduction histidine kinase
MGTLSSFWSEQPFMPHGHCYLWTPSLVFLQVTTNALIGLAYVAISLTLVEFRRRVEPLPFRFVYLAFGVFIVACGFTHFMDVCVIWRPLYWIDAALRALTAVASVGTAAVLPQYVPKAVKLAQGMRRVRREGVELEAALNDLSTLYRSARELDEQKTNFFANASHELRTPLTLILTPLASLVGRGDLPPDAQRELAGVLRHARLLSSLVDDLLDIQKLDAGKLAPSYRSTDLRELVRETAAHFESISRERRVTFSLQLPVAVPAQIDAEKIRRVLLNLLSNAFKFTPPGGAVDVELTLAPNSSAASAMHEACLRVRDTGPGIPELERARLFERFSQGNAVARGAVGTGLGLSIVRELVQLHGGSVELKRTDSAGAAFVVRLPLSRGMPSEPAQDRALPPLTAAELEITRAPSCATSVLTDETAEAADAASAGSAERPRVLVVEDNAEMRRLVVGILAARYRVIEAEDGERALRHLHDHEPDLIVSDLMMPKLDGEQLLRAVRAVSAYDGLPILLLTAKADEEFRARILRSGVQDYLLKPFEREELLARVHNLVSMRRAHVLLQREVAAQQADTELLTRAVLEQKRQLEAALSLVSAAREEAEAASRQKSDFLSLVSHELRTPLTSIRLQLARLTRGLTGPISPKQADVVDKIARSGTRLSELVESLLQFGRIESGRLVPEKTLLDLSSLAHDVVDELCARAEAKALTMRVECSADRMPLASDPALVRLIMVNLCDNAIKYTNQGEIVIAVERSPAGAARISIRDTGPGIASAAQERVFQPFVQLEDVRHKRGTGVGLGLSLVRRIAAALGAEVSLDSAEGSGSRFTVTFPKHGGSIEAL